MSASSPTDQHTVNKAFDPNDPQEQILDIMEEGRVNPAYLREQLPEMTKQTIEYHLRELRNAGWIKRVSRGLYELNYRQ